MPMTTLESLLTDALKDLYSAENQLVKALPKMAKAATNPDLRAGFEEHLEQTKTQVERLEQVFEIIGVAPKSKKCVAMEVLIEEGKELLKEDADPDVLDAGLIAAAQKVEHYEIASYGTLRTWAMQLGYQDAAELLQVTLDEEIQTDLKLTELATSAVNEDASGQSEDEADNEDEEEDEDAEEEDEDAEDEEGEEEGEDVEEEKSNVGKSARPR